MASGAVVGLVKQILQPTTLAAQPVILTGGSTPTERVRAFAFDPSAIEYIDFLCQLQGYAGGGLTLTFLWSSGATSGNVVWSAAIRRIADDAEDIDTAHTYDYNNASADATASASREIAYTTLTFTDGADIDSLANNEEFILRVRRVATDAGDTLNSNDAELWDVWIKET